MRDRDQRNSSRPSPLGTQILALLALVAWGLIPAGPAAGRTLRLREALRSGERNRADYERMERGYYERLLDAGRRQIGPPEGSKADFAAAGTGTRTGWLHLEAPPFEAGPLAIAVDDLREFVLKPSLVFDHEGARWSTNALGMRDREYPIAKPQGTLRIAFVGDSIGAGWGVNDGEGFEPLLERSLDERSRRAGGPAVEILNFAVPGHGPGQRWDHFSRVGWSMAPDLVLFESTLADAGWDERRLRGLLPRGAGWDAPVYRDALAASGARPGQSVETYKRALRPYRDAFFAGVYRTVVADCRAHKVPCVLILVPRVGKTALTAERIHVLQVAQAAGFTHVIDLTDAYEGIDPTTLAIGPDDFHPNAGGHALLAGRLDAAMRRRPDLQRLWTSAPRTSAQAQAQGAAAP
jgi:lysophospholipase L1-like esterase